MESQRPAAYRPNQLADGILPFGRTVIYRLIREGKIRSIKVGGARIIPAEAIDEFLKSGDAA